MTSPVGDFYSHHRASKELTYTDRVIYSPAVPAILTRRATRVLRVAAANGHQRLVPGAWGCGVFGNDPEVVAQAFMTALRHNRFFTEVVFAVLDRQPAPAFTAFAEVFGALVNPVAH